MHHATHRCRARPVCVLAHPHLRRRLCADPARLAGGAAYRRRGLDRVEGPRAGEDLADVLAYHYATALDLARAAGEADRAAELKAPARRS